MVKEIVEGGPARAAGIQVNDIIIRIEGQETLTMDDMSSIIYDHKAGDRITVTVWREGRRLT
jgi:serine protease Do